MNSTEIAKRRKSETYLTCGLVLNVAIPTSLSLDATKHVLALIAEYLVCKAANLMMGSPTFLM